MLRILEIYCYSKLATALRRSLTICDVFWPQASQSRKSRVYRLRLRGNYRDEWLRNRFCQLDAKGIRTGDVNGKTNSEVGH